MQIGIESTSSLSTSPIYIKTLSKKTEFSELTVVLLLRIAFFSKSFSDLNRRLARSVIFFNVSENEAYNL